MLARCLLLHYYFYRQSRQWNILFTVSTYFKLGDSTVYRDLY
jgi:hypothetical protein